jgi:hypothetical protein
MRDSFPKRDLYRQPTLTAGVALSYFHPERSEGFAFRNIFKEKADSSSSAAVESSE